jgi:hypothetical protein
MLISSPLNSFRYRWYVCVCTAPGIKFADMTPQSRVNDLVVYEAVSDGEGPAMTWGMMAMG